MKDFLLEVLAETLSLICEDANTVLLQVIATLVAQLLTFKMKK